MSLNGFRSESPDTAYTREAERVLKDALERIAKLERDVKYLTQRVNRNNG